MFDKTLGSRQMSYYQPGEDPRSVTSYDESEVSFTIDNIVFDSPCSTRCTLNSNEILKLDDIYVFENND